MWYEALPSLVLTGFFVCLPYGIIPVVHKLTQNGNVTYFHLLKRNKITKFFPKGLS